MDALNTIVSQLHLSRNGANFVEELVEKFGSRFGGSEEERLAAEFIRTKMLEYGLDKAEKEEFECNGWTRKETRLSVFDPIVKEVDCIALPFCPPGEIEGKLVYLGDGDPQAYEDNREKLKGAIAMVNTATPKFYHRQMHRGEKLGRAIEAGAIGFIWMRGEPGGLPETGSARFNKPCEVPAISVSYETGHFLLRLARDKDVSLRIYSDNTIQRTNSYNVVGEIIGSEKPDEIILIGGHYDGHDINESANDNGAGTAVVMETARALANFKGELKRTIRFVAFAQEETGLIGSEEYVKNHLDENFVFMLNLDGAGRGFNGTFSLQGWSENISFFKKLLNEIYETSISVGDRISLYSDMYYFAANGFPAATYASAAPSSSGAPRGFGHTYYDSLDKLNPKAIQMDAAMVAKLLYMLSQMDDLPMKKKTPQEFRDKLEKMGYIEILKYETRKVPGE